jgi:hypothetical protein
MTLRGSFVRIARQDINFHESRLPPGFRRGSAAAGVFSPFKAEQRHTDRPYTAAPVKYCLQRKVMFIMQATCQV